MAKKIAAHLNNVPISADAVLAIRRQVSTLPDVFRARYLPSFLSAAQLEQLDHVLHGAASEPKRAGRTKRPVACAACAVGRTKCVRDSAAQSCNECLEKGRECLPHQAIPADANPSSTLGDQKERGVGFLRSSASPVAPAVMLAHSTQARGSGAVPSPVSPMSPMSSMSPMAAPYRCESTATEASSGPTRCSSIDTLAHADSDRSPFFYTPETVPVLQPDTGDRRHCTSSRDAPIDWLNLLTNHKRKRYGHTLPSRCLSCCKRARAILWRCARSGRG